VQQIRLECGTIVIFSFIHHWLMVSSLSDETSHAGRRVLQCLAAWASEEAVVVLYFVGSNCASTSLQFCFSSYYVYLKVLELLDPLLEDRRSEMSLRRSTVGRRQRGRRCVYSSHGFSPTRARLGPIA
jgi:hypothetical protein